MNTSQRKSKSGAPSVVQRKKEKRSEMGMTENGFVTKREDLIHRGALLDAYDMAHKGPPGGARQLIETAPAVDAVLVEHSFWVPCDYVEYDHHGECVHYPDEGIKCFKCCYCFREKYLWSREYCPHCGAKMDGNESDAPAPGHAQDAMP